MRKQGWALLLGAVLLVGGVTPARAQSYRFDLGVYGGGSWWSKLVDADQTGSGSVSFEPSWLIGAQATLWAVPRVGLRLNFPYEDRALEASEGTLFTGDDARSLEHNNIWGPSLDLLFRLKQPATSFVGSEFLPYLAVGGGIRYVNPAGDRYTAYDYPNSEKWDGVPFGIGTGDTLFLSELMTPMVLLGLGSDLRLAPLMALRFEVGDRLSKPYAYRVTPTADPRTYLAVDGNENDASWAHDIYGTIGLHLTLGGAGREEVVVVAPPPPPAPQPPPPPAPAAPPAPREESVSVCVIDPAASGGVRMVSATFLPESRDTVVMQSGQRVAFRTTVPTVTVAENADWLVAGRPLSIATTPAATMFLPVGQSRSITDGSLVLVGTVNGLPVFAERAGLSAVAAKLGTTGDVAVVLRDAEVRRAFEGVQTLYVPYRTVGCVFQPLQRQEEVRKGK